MEKNPSAGGFFSIGSANLSVSMTSIRGRREHAVRKTAAAVPETRGGIRIPGESRRGGTKSSERRRGSHRPAKPRAGEASEPEPDMKLAIGNDHVAVDMKRAIRAHLEERGIEVVDVGTDSPDRFDYPISGYRVARLVASGEVDGGVLICGTGVGISLAANKVDGIRACVCSEPYTARLSKQHNNANIIAFGARVVGIELAKMIVDEWLDAEYEGGRHQARIDMIAEIEATQGLRAADPEI